MSPRFPRIVSFAASFGAVALLTLSARPATAQFTLDGSAYYVTGDHTLSEDVSGFEIMVGKTSFTQFDTITDPIITLNIGDGAVTTYSDGLYPDDFIDYYGVNVFGGHFANVSGTATLTHLASFDNSTVSISGGTISDYLESYDSSKINISGGTIDALVAASNNSTISITGGEINDDVLVGDNATVNISGGTTNYYVVGGDTSTINVSGDANSAALWGYYDSIINVSGNATVGELIAYDDSVVNISESATLDFVGGVANSTVNISGGIINFEVVGAQNGTINIFGGIITTASGYDNTVFNITGGFITDVFADGNSMFNLSGGWISASTIYQLTDTATINLYGTEIVYSNPIAMNFEASPGEFYSGVYYDVAWTQGNGTVINTRYFDANGDTGAATPQGIIFTVVPEPGTFALILPVLGVLGLVVARRKRK